MMGLQHPIGRVRGLGSAKSGSHHWWSQRITAIALVPLTLWFVYSALTLAGSDYDAGVKWLAQPTNGIFMVLLVIATFHHLQLGLQVVIEDYVHHEAVKLTALVIMKLSSIGLAVAATFSIIKVSFGG
tara:strand:- start:402 stop:785 length:384 start_codon:yes stop_codon:yes gene_type:complete